MPTATPARAPTGRPSPDEYAPYAGADIAAVRGEDAVDALIDLANLSPALFQSLASLAERGSSYAPGKWTVKQLLGHLIDDERIFGYRLLCVARGEEAELPGFDENRYAALAEFETRSLESLVEEYRAVRMSTLSLLTHLPSAA